ncbi:lysosome membrane protein 2c [Salvelinus sp. IW2-2015]|uniref:lysosome membrane protein 2c n=1 Tax=Salvelinus sp. IW2-2015 TaxID=2691554 RepID=UPI0038D3E8C3
MSVKSCCIYSTGVISILTLIAGIVLVLSQVFQNILNAKIKKEIVLRNGTHAFDVWENPPPPVYMQFYFFNVTNPAEVLKGERPAVLEVGPYTYSSLNWWTTDECNMINGTNGASFHPIITKNETLYMFSSDLCRSIYAIYEEESSVMGVPGYRFSPPSKVFANTTENAGFCSPPGNCLGSGVLQVSACKQDAPIVMSSPHFYQADEKFVKDIFGMKPDKKQHETIIDINPLTGIVLQAAKRLQVNVFVEKIPVFSQTGDIRTLVFPVLYLNESVVIDEISAKQLQVIVAEGNVVVNIPFMLIGLGILLGVVFMVVQCRQRIPESSSAERQPLLKS